MSLRTTCVCIFWAVFIFLLVMCAVSGTTVDAENLVVKTQLGTVMGHHQNSYGGRVFTAFEGIPYAKPPVGDLRFREPQPPKPWEGILMTNRSYYNCTQYMNLTGKALVSGDEDCLYLNVYVPKEAINDNDNFSVIVNIHGGAFMAFSASLGAGPNYVMDRDVIYVNMNYRLSMFGFLSTEDEVVPGNNGLKDQVAALKWVKTNIQYFGGNPDSITILGVSAGGASVHFHYLSPLSKGLFNRGMSNSGVALNAVALVDKPLEKARKLGDILKCPTDSTKAMVDCLRQKPAKDISLATENFIVFANILPMTPFGPVVENGIDAFLPAHPYKLLFEGNINDCTWIASNTKDEGLLPAGVFRLMNKLGDFGKRWDELAPIMLDYNETVVEEQKVTVAKAILHFYFNDQKISRKTFKELVKLYTDRYFVIDAEKAIRLQAKVSKFPVYYYRYSYQLAQFNLFKTVYKGTGHGEDGVLLYSGPRSPKVLPNSDLDMKNILLDFLFAYATTGKPTIKGSDWLPVGTSEELNYIEIESPDKITAAKALELAPTEFWNGLPIIENDKIFKAV